MVLLSHYVHVNVLVFIFYMMLPCLQEGMKKVISNAYTQYLKSRPHAASESIKRAKQTDFSSIGTCTL